MGSDSDAAAAVGPTHTNLETFGPSLTPTYVAFGGRFLICFYFGRAQIGANDFWFQYSDESEPQIWTGLGSAG